MRLTVLRGENIGTSDQETSMDPFVRVVYDGREVGMTHIVRKTSNPEWDIEIRFPLLETWDMSVAYAVLEVRWNDDSMHSEFISLCRANFSLMQGPYESTLLKCQLIRGSARIGWLYVKLQLEDTEYSFYNKAKRMDIRDILPPHNDRFHHLYAPIPRVWHPLHDCVVPSNERVLYIVEEVSLTFHVTEANQGVLALMVLTTFRLWFIPYTPVQGLNHEDVHTIPLGKIAKLTQTQAKQKQTTIHGLTIENMDAGMYSVTLNSRIREGDSEAKRIRTLIRIVNEIEWLQLENNFCAFTEVNLVESHPEANVLAEHPIGISPMINQSFISDGLSSSIYSSSVPSNPPSLRSGASLEHLPKQPLVSPTGTCAANKRRIRYDAATEYRRQGVFDHPAWRHTTINDSYGLCPSYPTYLVVPNSVGDGVLGEAARFRSKKRFPTLTWLHPRTGAPLCRSSQPKSGLLRSTSKEDRDLLWAIRDATYAIDSRPKPSTLVHIVDCRPEINAKSNALAGKGHESSKTYERDGNPCASIVFMGIDNIHVVRASFSQLSQALYQVDDATFYSTLQKSRQVSWLEHINSILVGATEVATHLERGDAVLVHCSDGWDRTSQLCALAQLMLDPHFRTVEGFAILVEKDWCSFGHNFAKRCGYPATDETSPVFQQFLDAVYQLTLQFPTHFQFNELFLSTIADAVYSSWYGTFQKNSERERSEFLKQVPTISIWDTIRASTEMYRNPLHITDHNAMLPVCRVRLMQLWTSQHQKAISHMRLQQREVEMLSLIRQQERELTRLRDLLSPEQNLEMKIAQLRSEILKLSRKISIHHESLVPNHSFTTTPATTPEKNAKILRRLTNVSSPTNGSNIGTNHPTMTTAQPPDLLRTSSMRMKQGLAALLTGKQYSDLTSLRNEYQDLTRQFDEMRGIAASLDEDAYASMQQLRFQNFNLPLEDVSVIPDHVKDEITLMSPSLMVGPVVTATVSNAYSSTVRNVNLLAMTDFNVQMHGVKNNGAPRSNSVFSARTTLNTQPVWESDKDAACCKQCKKKFIAVVRNRHHCRCCGYVFCGKCTSHRMLLPEFGYYEMVRVCRACYNINGGEEPIPEFERSG